MDSRNFSSNFSSFTGINSSMSMNSTVIASAAKEAFSVLKNPQIILSVVVFFGVLIGLGYYLDKKIVSIHSFRKLGRDSDPEAAYGKTDNAADLESLTKSPAP
jgi:hypothetical protein